MSKMSFRDVSERIQRTPSRLGTVRLIAIDGRSGSGKTTFAERLLRTVAEEGHSAALLHTDDLLEGWVHPSDFSERLRKWVLDPIEKGKPARYRVYDWNSRQFGTQWNTFDVPSLLIMEGVTTASAMWAPVLSFSVFVEAEPTLCLRRATVRDGVAITDEWRTWQAAEREHFMLDATKERVDVIVDGAPTAAHDPETEFIVLSGPEPQRGTSPQ